MHMVIFKDPDPHGGFSGQEGGEGVGVHRRRSLGWGNVTRCEQNRKTRKVWKKGTSRTGKKWYEQKASINGFLGNIHPQEEEKRTQTGTQLRQHFSHKILSLVTTPVWVGVSLSSPTEGALGTATKPQGHAPGPTFLQDFL